MRATLTDFVSLKGKDHVHNAVLVNIVVFHGLNGSKDLELTGGIALVSAHTGVRLIHLLNNLRGFLIGLL